MTAHSDEFLASSNAIYDECQRGIASLDKVIVSCASLYSDSARTALVPALYAYWERFFKATFSEFLRCVSIYARPLRELNRHIGRLRLRREVIDRVSKPDILLRAVDNATDDELLLAARRAILGARDALHEIELLCDAPVTFADPESWIQTESNVRFEVVHSNCKRLGLDIEALKQLLEKSSVRMHPALKELVDTRNAIAHGETFTPISSKKWDELRGFTLSLMNATQLFLYEAISDDAYLLAC